MKLTRRQLRRIIKETLDPLDPMSGREAWATKDFSPPDPVTGLKGRERVIYPAVLKRADWVIRDAGLSPDDPALVPMYREAYRWAGQTGTPRVQDIVLKLEDLIAADQRKRNLAQYGQESEEMPPEGLGMSHDVMGEPDPLYESMLRRIIKEELSRALLREAVSLEDALEANGKDMDDLRDSDSQVREEDYKDIIIVDLEEGDNRDSYIDLISPPSGPGRRDDTAEFKVGDEMITLRDDERISDVHGMYTRTRYGLFLRK